MQTFKLEDFPEALRGSAVVIGNFDGVHRGHAWVLQEARGYGLPVVVLTFEPHPRAVLLPHSAPFRLTPGPSKAEALTKAGADAVVALDFDLPLAQRTAEDFAEVVVAEGLAPALVVVGHDYRFGRDRAGDTRLLAQVAERRGFRLVTASAAKNSWGERFSSSRIRDHILAGDLAEAQRLLGRPWTIGGEALADGGGRFSLDLGDHLRPPPGRYAITLRSQDARPAHGAAILHPGADRLVIEGAEAPGPVTLFLHQRLGAPDVSDVPAEGVAQDQHIFYAAE